MSKEEREALLAIGHWVEFHGGDGKLSQKVKKTMKALRSSTQTPSPLKNCNKAHYRLIGVGLYE